MGDLYWSYSCLFVSVASFDGRKFLLFYIFFPFIIDKNFAVSPHGFSFLETASLAPLNHFWYYPYPTLQCNNSFCLTQETYYTGTLQMEQKNNPLSFVRAGFLLLYCSILLPCFIGSSSHSWMFQRLSLISKDLGVRILFCLFFVSYNKYSHPPPNFCRYYQWEDPLKQKEK